MKRVIRVGSRDSKLAIAQTMIVLEEIKKYHPKIEFQLVTMKTTGDKILDRNLDQIGGKGLFVKELDKALLEGHVDFTVHSLKDLPMEISEELPLIGFSKREDPRDCLLVKKGAEDNFHQGCIGTSSRRRMEQLKKIYPHAKYKGIRGNIQTRLHKLETEDYDATVLAMAGLKRMEMQNMVYRVFEIEELLPAAGQGILALQGRKGEDYSYLQCVCSKKSEYISMAERAFVQRLDGGCSSPIAAYAEIKKDKIKLRGLYYHEPANTYSVEEIEGAIDDAKAIGIQLAETLLAKWK